MKESNLPLVTLDGVGVRRDGRWLVRGLDFSIEAGEIVTVIGPNGSGKSTAAKAALGLLRPDEGRVVRHGALKVGYVPQSIHIDRTMPLTVARFMALNGRADPNRRNAALERTGAAHLLDNDVQTLSGGEFQRVMLARAMIREPNLLVLDEPIQGVDFHGEVELYRLIADLRDETGCGILLISHDLHVVMAATDRVVCLNGHVCCQGTPTAVMESDAYRNLFGRRAASALAVYRHDHDHTHLADGRVKHEDAATQPDASGQEDHQHAG